MLSISLRSEVFKIGGDCIYKHFVPTALFPTDSIGVEARWNWIPRVAATATLGWRSQPLRGTWSEVP